MIRLLGGAIVAGTGAAIAASEFLMTYPSKLAFIAGIGLVAVGGLLILDWWEGEVA